MDNSPIRVLLVENDEDDYVTTRDLLGEIQGRKFDLEWVDSYEMARSAIALQQHDVYLLNYCIGDRNGLELLREMRSAHCQAPAIFLTGETDYAVDVEAMQAGAADFLVKGQIDARSLERAIRYAIARSQTMSALQQSEARYRAIVEEQTELICRFLPDGTLTFVNQAYCRYFGKQPEEVIGQRFALLIPDEEAEQFGKYLASLTPENPVGTIERRILLPPGESRILHWTNRAIFNEQSQLVEFQAVGRDISEGYASAKGLRNQAEAVLRNVAEGVSVTTGEAFFQSLVQYLAKTLEADCAYIGELTGENSDRVKTSVVCAHGKIGDNFEYALANTPCERAIAQELCYYPRGVQEHFPNSPLLREMGIESFLGTSLCDSAGRPLGLLVVLNSKPLQNPEAAASLLQIFALRASAELERKRSEAALQKSEELYRTLAANFPNGIVLLFDRDLRYTLADGTELAPLGLSKELLEGKTLWEVFPSEICELIEPNYRAALAGVASTFEWKYPNKIYLVQALPIRNESGEIFAGMVVAQDITERDLAEQALRRGEQEFKALVENTPDIISRFDTELRHVYVNPAIELATGLSPEAFLGKTHREVGMPEELASYWQQILLTVLETGREAVIEFEFPSPNGARFYQARILPEFGSDLCVATLLIISRDLTDRKRVEEALKQANEGLGIAVEERTTELREAIARLQQEIVKRRQTEESLRQSEQKNRAILNAIPDLMFRVSSDGTYLDFLPPKNMEAVLSASELLGKKVHEVLPQEVARQTRHYIEEALTKRERQVFEYQLLENGEFRDFEARVVVSGEGEVLVCVRDISDRKKIEIALRESEERYRILAEALPQFVWSSLPDGSLEYCNQHWVEYSGLSLEQSVKFGWISAVHPDDVQSALDARNRGQNTGKSYEMEYRVKRAADGIYRWHFARVSPLFDGEGKILKWIGSATDIDARKHAEAALADSERQMRAIFDSALDAIVISDNNGCYVDANPSACLLFGLPKEQLIGRYIRNFAKQDYDFESKWQTFQAKGLLTTEFQLVRLDGQVRELESFATANFLPDRHLAVLRDITERKRTEEALSRHAQILDLANDSIVIHDLNKIITYWNQGAQRLYGWTKEEAIGQHKLTLLQTVFPQPVDEIEETLLHQGAWEGEIIHTKRDGTQVTVASRWTLQRDDRGQPVAVLEINNDISDRKQAEVNLKKSEELYSTLARNFPNGVVFLFDWHLRYTLAEGQELTALGLSKELVQGKTIWEVHGLEECEKIEPIYRAALAGTQTVTEYQYANRIYSLQALPVKNDRGEIFAGMIVAQNITERKRSEEELRSSEQKFRSLGSCSPVGIFLTDIEGHCTYANPRYQVISDRSSDENLGEGWVQAIYPSDREWVFQEWSSCVRQGQEYSNEFRMQTRQGIVRWVHVRSSPLLSDEGQPIGYVGTVEDFTDRKVAEDSLRESEERFRQLAENINQVFWMISLATNEMLYISPGYEKIWGRSCNSLYDNRSSWMDAVYLEDRDRLLAFLQKPIAGNQYLKEEYRIVRPDGALRWICDRIFPVYNEFGEVYRIAGLAEDITERKRAEAEILNSLTKEKELSELKTRFVSMISHEFRTPLSTIISSADLLEYYIQECPAHKIEKKLEHLGRIQTAVVNLTHLLEDALFIGQTESGRVPFQPVLLDLTSFCRELVEEMQISNKTDCVLSFVQTCPGQDKSIIACFDRKLLRQVLSNLLSNAIKYSPSGRTVSFDLSCQDDRVAFQVQDRGIGILPEDKIRLFDAFHRGQNVGNLPGTGLGLTIVKQCVEVHGGTISVESEVGVGSTFTVTLPLKR